MRESFGDKKINFVHEGYNKSPKIYKSALLNEEHYRDPGHAIKSLRNAFDTVKKNLCFKKSENPFSNIADRVIAYDNYLIKNVDDPNLREILWLNTPEHLTGNHALCIHPSQVI